MGDRMKHFTKILVCFLVILVLPLLICMEGITDGSETKVFYNAEVYTLVHPLLNDDDRYYFYAPEISEILNLKYHVDSKRRIVFIEYGDYQNIFIIDNLLNSPKYINGEFYIPMDFFKDTYGLSIKTSDDMSVIYILPENTVDSSMFSVLNNLSCNYKINIPSHVTINFDDSDIIKDEVLYLKDKNNFYESFISCEIMDETSLMAMRSYLNDYKSDEKTIFGELVEYKKSYFRAMQEYYKTSFLYGGNPPDYEESNMKIFAEYDETLFGQNATITLYNTIHSGKEQSQESTHISISVPVYSTNSIYTIDFVTENKNLNPTALKRMSELVLSIEIEGQKLGKNELEIFSDWASMNDAKLGIYPDLSDVNIGYTALLNQQSGYRILYPSSAIPYMQNNIIEPYDYKSFKISYADYFSISVEPAQKYDTIKNKINLMKLSLEDSIQDIEYSEVNLSGKKYERLKYTVFSEDIPEYIDSFLTVHNDKLFIIQLNSRFKEPSRNVREEFAKIAASLEFLKNERRTDVNSFSFIKYVNPKKGYTISYPNKWLLQQSSEDSLQKTRINNPDYSGPLNIVISEAKINPELSTDDIMGFITSTTKKDIEHYLYGYNAPYLDNCSRLLRSSIKEYDEVLFVYRLINFMDSGKQNKLCYAVDIIKDNDIYSMFISVSQYMTINGALYDINLGEILKTISGTFGLVDPETLIKDELIGESAKRVIDAVKSYFKSSFRLDVEVKNPAYMDPSRKSIMVLVEGIPDSGYYIISTELKNDNLQLLQRILNRDILREAVSLLESRYSEKKVRDIETNEKDMTLKIEYRNNQDLQYIEKNYCIAVDRSNNNFNWKLERIDHSKTIMDYCEIFLENFVSKSVDIYFRNSDIDFSKSTYTEAKKQYIPVFAEFGNTSGYFILEINPETETGKINALSYTPLNFLSDRLRSIYNEQYPDYEIVNYTASDEDKFKINVFMLAQPSRTVSMFRMNQAKVVFDENKLVFTLVDEPTR